MQRASRRRDIRSQLDRTCADGDAPVDPSKVIALINKNPQRYRVAPDNQFLLIPEKEGLANLAGELAIVLKEIKGSDTIGVSD